MKESDIEKVSDLLCSCYRWLANVEKYNEDELNFLLTQRGAVETVKRESAVERYYVAAEDDRIIGMVSIKDSHITKLYVHPDCHGRGIGKKMFNIAKDEIIKSGFHGMNAVAIGESAVPFYERMGMKIVGRKKSTAPGFEGREGIQMRMSLNSS